MSLDTWFGFFAACWIISLTPGPGAIASMSSGLQYGFRRGYCNVFGLQLALAMQILIVAAGLGAIMTASALAFNLIKWFGVAYLVYLAIRQWRQAPGAVHRADQQQAPFRISSMIIKGFLVNASNPKAIIFILAILPQFINPAEPLIPQYSIIILTMIGVDMVVMAGYTSLAAKVLSFLNTPHQQHLLNRTIASLFVGAASLLSLVHRG